jgi:predicted N-acetyltransferase YhbS
VCLPTHSSLDSERFGIRVARVADMDLASVEPSTEWCKDEQIDLLVARCATSELGAVHVMQGHGYLLMGCLLTYEHRMSQLPEVTAIPGIRLTVGDAADADGIERVAREAFRDHGGHYHADRRLDREDVLEVYGSWARSAVLHPADGAMAVVAHHDREVIGFATLSHVGTPQPVGGVAAVASDHRGRGIYRALVTERLHRARASGATTTVVAADVVNPPSQNCWTSIGYRLVRSEYTFHRWFPR